MNNNAMDQKWQELKTSIEKLSDKNHGQEFYRIEYKPQGAIYLLEMPPGHMWKHHPESV